MGVMRPELVMKSIVPVVMAGVLGIYGLIIAVIISTGSAPPTLKPCMPPPGAWARVHIPGPGPRADALQMLARLRCTCPALACSPREAPPGAAAHGDGTHTPVLCIHAA